jgi:hypothetical protein
MAAAAKSTTIRIRNSQGAEWTKSLSGLTAGTDYYVFVKDAGGIVAQTGSTLANATKIGGFHTMCCSTTGLGTSHPYYNYAAGQIMPSSVWTIKHHPEDITGGYVYLSNLDDANKANNMTTAEQARAASYKPWVMIYPGTAYSGSSATNAGTGYTLRSQAIQDIGSGWGSNGWSQNTAWNVASNTSGQRLMRDGGFAPVSCGSYLSSGETNCPTTGSTASEYCAASEGNPDAGAAVYSSCAKTGAGGYSCKFASAGGYVRNSASMISNMGVWGTVGYLWEFIDRSSTQTACSSSNGLLAGGSSNNASSVRAARGVRYARNALSLTLSDGGVRAASTDISD